MAALTGENEETDQEYEQDELADDSDAEADGESDEAGESEAEIISKAKHRFKVAQDAEKEIRKEALEDLKFCAGEQWPAEIKYQRDQDKRPCLTINRLPQFVRQITNDQRQNRPSIKIDPVDFEGNTEIAEIFEGLVRHIEYASSAQIAYDTAFEQCAKGGFGYFRICSDYCDDRSFDQDITIKRIRNQFSVYLDPSSQEPDGSDCNWGMVFDELTRDEFKAQYPDAKLSQMTDWTSVGDQSEGWITSDGCRVCEYFEKCFERKMLYLLSDGETYLEDELPDQLEPGIYLVSERETVEVTVKWFKLNGLEVLEETYVPGKFIPIIPVYGEEHFIEGQRKLEGIIRHAKDPQRMLNFFKSYETEIIALAPKAPWIMAEGQDEGYEEMWKQANVRNYSSLKYKPKSIGGTPLPPPQRNTFEPPVQAITAAGVQFGEDLKSTTGIYDAELGNKSNEQSGVAIQRRNHQSQVSNFHFSDNFARSLRHAGRIIVEWIPYIYDTPRAVRIIGTEGEQKVVWINKIFQEKGQDKLIKLDRGKYDVTVDTGPSFQTKRQEAVAAMTELVRSYPNVFGIAGDLMVKNMDWPGAQQIAERLKKTLPPGLAQGEGQEPIPPQAQAQMQQMNQAIQILQKQLSEASEIIRTEKVKTESRERIEFEKMRTEMILEIMKTDKEHAALAFEQENKLLSKKIDLLDLEDGIKPSAGPNGSAQPGMNQQPTGAMPGNNSGA